MSRTYLVVFERNREGWSAFAPDIPNTGGLGNTLDEARRSLLEGISFAFAFAIEHAQPLPEPKTTNVDFSEFEGHTSESHYEVEWVNVPRPQSSSDERSMIQQAA
jgi:predicted RNase H-like HicB family nuclease